MSEIAEKKPNNFSKKTFAKNTTRVLLSNAFLLLVSLLTGFVVPALLGVQDYGYYKEFVLYSSYITIFQFGFINGIYLLYGGKDIDELKPEKFRLFTRILFVMEGTISLIGFLIAMFFFNGGSVEEQYYKVLILLLTIYSFVLNCNTYFIQITQITQQFKIYANRTYVQSILKAVIVGILWILAICNIKALVSFTFYTILFVLIYVFLFGWFLITFRNLVFGKAETLKENKSILLEIFKVGMPLLIADFVVVLVYSCNKQIVNIYFTTEEFAQFSFAYTIVSFIKTLVVAVSTVLYPTLKRTSEETLIKNFQNIMATMFIAGFALLISYFPIQIIIEQFLPDYIPSIAIFKIVLPGVVITSVINMIIQNYYKTFNKNMLYFYISLGILGLIIGANLIAYYVFGSMTAIAISSIIVFILWYIIGQIYFIKKYKTKIIKNLIYTLLILSIFYLSVFITDSMVISICMFVFGYTIITLVMYFEDIRGLIDGYFSKKRSKHKNNEEEILKIESQEKKINKGFKFISTKKKTILVTFGLLLSIFGSGAALGVTISDNSYSAVSEQIVNSREESGLSFSYGSIETPEPKKDTFSAYRSATNDIKGRDMKKSSKVFLHSAIDENHIPLQFMNGTEKVNSQIISTYSTYENSNYGFTLLCGYEFEDFSDSKFIYITQDLANKLLNIDNEDETTDYSVLVDKQYECYASRSGNALYPFTIKGVIDRNSLGDFETLYGNEFVYCQYNADLYYFNYLSIDFFLYGGSVATTTFVSLIEDSRKQFTDIEYQINYYDYNKSSETFELGLTQQYVQETYEFYSSYSSARVISTMTFGILCIVSCVFLFIVVKKLIIDEKNNKNIIMYIIMPLLPIISFTIIYILSYLLTGIIVSGVIIDLLGYLSISLLTYTMILLVILFISLFSKPKPKKEEIVLESEANSK